MSRSKVESSVVLRMLGDFDSFISKHSEQMKQPSLSGNVIRHLDFEESLFGERSSTDVTFSCGSSAGSPVVTALSLTKEPSSAKRKLEAELITSKNQLSRMQDKIASLEIEAKRAKIEYEKQLSIKLDQKDDENDSLHNVQLQLIRAIEKEAEMKKDLGELQLSYETMKTTYEQKLNSVERKKDEIKSSLEEQLSELNEAIFVLKSDLHRIEAENNSLKIDLEAAEEQLQKYSQRSTDVIKHMQETEKAKQEAKEANDKVNELQRQLAMLEDADKLIKILEGQLSNKKELEKENKQLKESNRILSIREDNVLLLKEELHSSKTEVEKLEKRAQLVAKLQLENEELKHKLNGWESLAIVGCQLSKSPESVAKAIGELQQQNLLLTEEIGKMTSRLKTADKATLTLEDELNKVKLENANNKTVMKQNSDQIRHLQRKLFLVSKERDACREIMDNYSKECTIVIPSGQENERVKKLETILDGYKRTVENLETDLKSAHEKLNKFGHQSSSEVEEEREKMRNEIKTLTTKVSSYESQVLQLQEEKKMLELRIEYDTLKGEINPLKTRVVHLSSNPVMWARQQRAQELENLKAENATLKQRVLVLESAAAGQIADITLKVEEQLKEGPPSKILEELRDKLQATEAKNKRIMEACKRISSEFRDTTYALVGYNIEFPCAGQYKLSNMYAESSNDYLLFAKSGSGELQLLETPYSLALKEKIETYLITHHSIPAFLSSLTLELFSSQTNVLSTTREN